MWIKPINQGKNTNTNYISFKKSTAAQTLLARVDCSIFNLDLKLLLSCNRSFADYLEDRLIDAVNY